MIEIWSSCPISLLYLLILMDDPIAGLVQVEQVLWDLHLLEGYHPC